MGQRDRKVEPLNQGLANARDPALLQQGELSEMRNAIYLPNSQALQRASGRQSFGVVSVPALVTTTTILRVQGTSGNPALTPYLAHGAATVTDCINDTEDGDGTYTTCEEIRMVLFWNDFSSVTLPATSAVVNFRGRIESGSGNVIGEHSGVANGWSFTPTTSYATYQYTLSPTELADLNAGFWGIDLLHGALFGHGTGTLRTTQVWLDITTVALATAPGLDIYGLRDAQFDNGNHYLVAHASSIYATALVGDSGTFASALSVTPGASLEAIHYDNEYYILNGTAADLTPTSTVALNEVMYLSATATATTPSWRTHGLNPVAHPPTPALVTGAFTVATGFYEYWTTESVAYIKDGTEQVLESTFTGTPINYPVEATGQAVSLTRPLIVNPAATRWTLYRSPRNESVNETSFPNGSVIGSAPTSQDTIIDGAALGGAYVFASATSTTFHNLLLPTPVSAGWASPINLTASDSVYATATAGIRAYNAGGNPIGNPPWAEVFLSGAVPAGVVDPISGIAMEVKGSRNYSCTVQVAFARYHSVPNLSYASEGRVIPLTTSNAVYTLGGENDVWGTVNRGQPPLAASDFTAPNQFAIRVIISSENGVTATTAILDYVKLKVYSGVGTITDMPFPAVVIEQSGLTTSIGSHGKPPVASTGDIFQASLVTNSVTEPSFIRYSLPLEPDYFPSVYFIDFETADNDIVTNIKTLNNRLGVFLKSSLYRVNYLPNENDATFDRGRALDAVSNQYGCYNAMCACTYTSGDGRTEIAYVSDHGIHSTDLMSISNLTDDLDWRTIIATSGSAPIALINDPDRWELLFYYKNTTVADNEHYRCLHLSYHPSHLKNGRPKISGQVHMRNYNAIGVYAALECAWVAKRLSGSTSVYLGYGGTVASASAAGAGSVYIEAGNVIPAYDPNFQFTTRRMFLNGFGREFRLNELYGYIPFATGTQTLRYTPYTIKTNAAGETQQGYKERTYAGEPLSKVQFNQAAEGLRINCTQTASADGLKYEFLILDGEGFGSEDSGKA